MEFQSLQFDQITLAFCLLFIPWLAIIFAPASKYTFPIVAGFAFICCVIYTVIMVTYGSPNLAKMVWNHYMDHAGFAKLNAHPWLGFASYLQIILEDILLGYWVCLDLYQRKVGVIPRFLFFLLFANAPPTYLALYFAYQFIRNKRLPKPVPTTN